MNYQVIRNQTLAVEVTVQVDPVPAKVVIVRSVINLTNKPQLEKTYRMRWKV